MRKNLILIIFVISLVLPLSALAIGQMTKPILIENALKGEEYEDILTLYNSSDYEETFNLIIKGEIIEWVKFYSLDNPEIPIEDIKAPANSKAEAKVKFSIPEDTPNGTYKGEVVVSFSPKNEKNEGEKSSLIIQQVPRNVFITVIGEQILSCKTLIISQNQRLNINESLKTNISCYNTGNVKIKPLIQQTIFKDGNIIFNVIHPYPEDKNGIKPKHSEVLTIEWQSAGQESGEYRAEIKVLLNNEVKGENDFRFIIVSDMEKFLAAISVIGGGNLTLAWFIIGTILLAITGILIFINKNQNFIKKRILKNGILKKWDRKLKKLSLRL